MSQVCIVFCCCQCSAVCKFAINLDRVTTAPDCTTATSTVYDRQYFVTSYIIRRQTNKMWDIRQHSNWNAAYECQTAFLNTPISMSVIGGISRTHLSCWWFNRLCDVHQMTQIPDIFSLVDAAWKHTKIPMFLHIAARVWGQHSPM